MRSFAQRLAFSVSVSLILCIALACAGPVPRATPERIASRGPSASPARALSATPAPSASPEGSAAEGQPVLQPSQFLPLAEKVPTQTPTAIPPPSDTATPTPSDTATPTPLPTSEPVFPAIFAIGSGGGDTIPHQIVRTSDDRVFIFANKQNSPIIYAYWTTAPGLPNSAAEFAGSLQANEAAFPLSVDAAYDGAQMIHLLVITNGGSVKDYPFDVSAATFRPALTLASDSATLSGDYIGSCGVSAMFDLTGKLHVVYWSAANHIVHNVYTYDRAQNRLTTAAPTTQVDAMGSANHPVVAVSPFDDSLTVAWVSDAAKTILARVRTAAGAWGNIETVSNSPVWTSPNGGINIDQGPSLLIDAQGVKHLAYIEDWAIPQPNDYGRIHYVENSGSGWVDQALSSYTHDPTLAITGAGQLYIIGHGYPLNAGCQSLDIMCTIKRNANGSWGVPQVFVEPTSGNSFDTSPSVKWSAVGFNRPDVIEFLLTSVPTGNYSEPTAYYARFR
jgi:hypothetical protein